MDIPWPSGAFGPRGAWLGRPPCAPYPVEVIRCCDRTTIRGMPIVVALNQATVPRMPVFRRYIRARR